MTTFPKAVRLRTTLATSHISGDGVLVLQAGDGTTLGALGANEVYAVTAVVNPGTFETIVCNFRATGLSGDTLTGVTSDGEIADASVVSGTTIQVRVTKTWQALIQSAINAAEAAVALRALDSAVVHRTGNVTESINGPKTFTDGITGPDLDGIGVRNFDRIVGRDFNSVLHVAGNNGLNGTLYLNYLGGDVFVAAGSPGTFNVNNGKFLVGTTGAATIHPVGTAATVTRLLTLTDDQVGGGSVGAGASIGYATNSGATRAEIVLRSDPTGGSNQSSILLRTQNDGIGTLSDTVFIGYTGTVISSPSAGKVALTVQGFASQSANLQEWQNSSGVAKSFVGPTGIFTAVNGGADAIYGDQILLAASGFPTTFLSKIKTSASVDPSQSLVTFSVNDGTSGGFVDVLILDGSGTATVTNLAIKSDHLNVGIAANSVTRWVRVLHSSVPAFLTNSYDGSLYAYSCLSGNSRPDAATATASLNSGYDNLYFFVECGPTNLGRFRWARANHTAGTPTIADLMFLDTSGLKLVGGLGLFGATPVAQHAAIADATDAATTQAALNTLLAYLRSRGDIAT